MPPKVAIDIATAKANREAWLAARGKLRDERDVALQPAQILLGNLLTKKLTATEVAILDRHLQSLSASAGGTQNIVDQIRDKKYDYAYRFDNTAIPDSLVEIALESYRAELNGAFETA